MSLIDISGTIAATLTTVSFVPQAVKVIRTGHTKDISLTMYIILITGVCFWIAYGIMLVQWPIIISNIVTLLPTLAILVMKMKEKE